MKYISDKARRFMLKRARLHVDDDTNELFSTIAAPLFYATDLSSLKGDVDTTAMRLPANPCWIEHNSEFCVVFWCTTENKIEWMMFALASKRPPVVSNVAMGDLEDIEGGVTIITDRNNLIVPNDKKTIEDIEKCVGASAYLAKIFASFQSSVVEVPLSAGRKMQARQGRGRIFRHYEIDLAAARRQVSERQHRGGTHAPPAWHIRRGHMRRLKDGRSVFVRSCEVGNKDRGAVLKDYRLSDEAGG